jgi:hypothetical protein
MFAHGEPTCLTELLVTNSSSPRLRLQRLGVNGGDSHLREVRAYRESHDR